MKLIVGLGNPGSEYVATRHNIGFEVIDQMAARLGWVRGADGFNQYARSKFAGLMMDGIVQRSEGESEKIVLLKPLTFMNLSGQSVQQAASFYQLLPHDVLIALDDVALPCGKLRLRASGSSGGHNGLKDIQRALGTESYPRLRIGVNPPPPRVPQRDYVLGRFSADQRALVDPAIARACGCVLTWIDKGITAAMNDFNRDENETE